MRMNNDASNGDALNLWAVLLVAIIGVGSNWEPEKVKQKLRQLGEESSEALEILKLIGLEDVIQAHGLKQEDILKSAEEVANQDDTQKV